MPHSSGPPRDFDDFYLTSRRRLVLQAYALTGDLGAARNAVRDAFVAARHHWAKVGRLPDPEEWLRPRAWAMAQRRHAGRPWHREKGLHVAQREVLEGLHKLSDHQRKTLLLTSLAGLGLDDVGRELGVSRERAEVGRERATRRFCEETGTPEDGVTEALESLAPLAEAAALPGVTMIDRGGRRRRRQHALAGTVGVLLVCLLGGLFVVRGGVTDPAKAQAPGPTPRPVVAEMLLDTHQAGLLAPDQRWREVGTTDNTSGTGIHSVCQDQRFADPRGRSTFVRTFVADGRPRRRLVQTVEVSRTARASAAAYRTTLRWFAGCRQARLQLLGAFRVRGLGEQAQLLKLRIPNQVRRTYVVGLVRSGSLTMSTVLETVDGNPADLESSVKVLDDATRRLCDADASGPCPMSATAAPVLPPPSGEAPGTLAAADLPAVGRVNKPWVGTRPVLARPNVAATSCDRADFDRAGAVRPMSRVFLVPQAHLPRRFGITETYGAFRSVAKAKALVTRIRTAMATCEKRDLGASVSSVAGQPKAYRGSEYYLWRLDSEIDKSTKVGFWMGVTRVGRYVAQVNLTPAGDLDVDADTFQALVSRGRDRLFELSR